MVAFEPADGRHKVRIVGRCGDLFLVNVRIGAKMEDVVSATTPKSGHVVVVEVGLQYLRRVHMLLLLLLLHVERRGTGKAGQWRTSRSTESKIFVRIVRWPGVILE